MKEIAFKLYYEELPVQKYFRQPKSKNIHS